MQLGRKSDELNGVTISYRSHMQLRVSNPQSLILIWGISVVNYNHIK